MRPSVSLRAVGILLAAVAAGLIVLSRPGAVPVGIGALALAPISALVLVGPARALAIAGALGYAAALNWAYTSHFSPVYAYSGLIDADPTPTAAPAAATRSAASPERRSTGPSGARWIIAGARSGFGSTVAPSATARFTVGR